MRRDVIYKTTAEDHEDGERGAAVTYSVHKGAVATGNALSTTVDRRVHNILHIRRTSRDVDKAEQEAQLPQRNSASAAHMEGGWG